MQQDAYIDQIDAEVLQLQEKLKDRLKEAQDISDLSKSVQKDTLTLEKTTVELKKTAEETKWKILLEYYKWILAIGCVFVLIILLILYR